MSNFISTKSDNVLGMVQSSILQREIEKANDALKDATGYVGVRWETINQVKVIKYETEEILERDLNDWLLEASTSLPRFKLGETKFMRMRNSYSMIVFYEFQIMMRMEDEDGDSPD